MNELLTYRFNLDSFFGVLGYVLLVIFISWIASRMIRYVIVQIIKRRKIGRYGGTSILFLRNSVKFFIGIFSIIYIISTVPAFRSKATLIFSGAGILAAIIGFAAQAALSNLIAGIFIVLFRPFRVGDYIKLDQERVGIVEDITLRHTVINNFENKRLIIPNSVISTDSVLNHTIEDSHILSFNNFKVGIKANIDLARKIIQEEAVKLPTVIDFRTAEQVMSDAPQIDVRVIDIHTDHIHLRAYVWLNEPFKEFKNKCALKEAVHKRFLSEGVALPIPIYKIVNV
ncbi:mechanosensitive ion channel family protein [Tenacibaculum finnmarkense genomovar finnmarkense]|uniref:mechanosensitive ion channel family protein n=1 Tax=Tenacibaculum finnmarkense TaxID=2781243 RepID=UPI001E6572B3|nr:mechanosensitive ion channel family protein [Tenacibaculum finnmarkense]MCD8402983.1 mechanosensitive ion channel family protein [Tenacibaculum finnmarkense genomovar finnmarkense]MCD8416834.1 mechanosensitive ion channel family protein [Tenacibaculum finnmarkense genomovar finnmarkense]MCD8447050.1 mechanosensitive ion channel family protein [Tenacibaculum finnmarkense genomovar finnmarkense]MCG8185528.1 mechanosensitive ion channel family protein [Tenacibaculum finnmarkense genomovar finnm